MSVPLCEPVMFSSVAMLLHNMGCCYRPLLRGEVMADVMIWNGVGQLYNLEQRWPTVYLLYVMHNVSFWCSIRYIMFNLGQVINVYRGSRGIAVLFL